MDAAGVTRTPAPACLLSTMEKPNSARFHVWIRETRLRISRRSATLYAPRTRPSVSGSVRGNPADIGDIDRCGARDQISIGEHGEGPRAAAVLADPVGDLDRG